MLPGWKANSHYDDLIPQGMRTEKVLASIMVVCLANVAWDFEAVGARQGIMADR